MKTHVPVSVIGRTYQSCEGTQQLALFEHGSGDWEDENGTISWTVHSMLTRDNNADPQISVGNMVHGQTHGIILIPVDDGTVWAVMEGVELARSPGGRGTTYGTLAG